MGLRAGGGGARPHRRNLMPTNGGWCTNPSQAEVQCRVNSPTYAVSLLNRHTLFALVTAWMLAGCSKSPEQMTCVDDTVQTDVRKLMVIKVRDWQEPVSTTTWLKEHTDKQHPDVAATLNGFKARSVLVDGVKLSDITELSKPQSPLLDADPSDGALPTARRPKKTGNKLLYQCSGVIQMPIPSERANALPKSSRALLGINQDMLNVAIRYQTELTPEGKMWVAVALDNPLQEMMLRVLFAKAPDESSNEPK